MIEQPEPMSEFSEPVPAMVEKAALGRRFIANFIDSFILSLISQVIPVLAGNSGSALLWFFIALAIPAFYFIYPYSTNGQTPGKRAMDIKVVSMDGSPLNWRKGLLRSVGYILSTIPFGFGYLWALWDKDKQAGHDKIAGTCVVPVSVKPEQLQGSIALSEIGRRQRRWLVGLGIPAFVLIAGIVGLVRGGIGEITAMNPWPGREVAPADSVNVDLSPLGLHASAIQDARTASAATWGNGTYEQGAVVTYEADGETVVVLSALRYADAASASIEFSSIQARGCGVNVYVHLFSSGLIRCGYGSYLNKTFWNDYWIIDVVVQAKAKFRSDVLVDQVRDAVAAHWRTIGQS